MATNSRYTEKTRALKSMLSACIPTREIEPLDSLSSLTDDTVCAFLWLPVFFCGISLLSVVCHPLLLLVDVLVDLQTGESQSQCQL